MAESWRAGVAKELERQNAALVQAEPSRHKQEDGLQRPHRTDEVGRWISGPNRIPTSKAAIRSPKDRKTRDQ
jgi:hypothetical protein